MKIRMSLLAAACGLALAACGGETPAPAEPAAATPAAEAPVAAAAPVEAPAATVPEAAPAVAAGPAAVVSDCSTTIESNDAMQFNAASIAVPAACTDFTIKLVHTGQMPVAAMGHNVVIAAQTDMAGLLAIVGVALLPVIHWSVEWWNSLHQGATIKLFGKSAMDPSMQWPLWWMVAGTHVWFIGSLLARARADNLRREAGKDWVARMAGATP